MLLDNGGPQRHPGNGYSEFFLIRLSALARSTFDEHGYLVLTATEDDRVIFVCVNKRRDGNEKERLSKAMERWVLRLRAEYPELTGIKWGAGKKVLRELDLHASYQMAETALRVQERLKDDSKHFYEDLHVYRLVSQIGQIQVLESFIQDYIGPVLEYDRQKKGDLYLTLKAFLDCKGSKQDTASRLFIVRQTLYYRLEKIEALLGGDFMETEKRLAIEFAIRAHEYLTKGKAEEWPSDLSPPCEPHCHP